MSSGGFSRIQSRKKGYRRSGVGAEPVTDRGPALAVIILCSAIVIDAAATVRGWFWRRPTPMPVARSSAPHGPSHDAAGEIAAGHVFGVVTEDRPASGMSLELRGTLALADAAEGLGIIAERGGAEHLYAVGAGLPGGGFLRGVYVDHVVVGRGATLETLALPRGGLGGQGLRVADATLLPPDIAAPTKRTHKYDPDRPTNVVASPVTRSLHVLPVVIDDKLYGYTVSPRVGAPGLAGLEPHAVISAINGVPLVDGAVATRMFEAIAQQGRGTVTVVDWDGTHDVPVNASGLAAQANKQRQKPSG